MDRDPLEHLRRAVAASRADRAAASTPAIYTELRLLLNQLEAGRISEEPSATLVKRERVEPPPPPSIRSLVRDRVVSRLRPAFRLARSFLRP